MAAALRAKVRSAHRDLGDRGISRRASDEEEEEEGDCAAVSHHSPLRPISVAPSPLRRPAGERQLSLFSAWEKRKLRATANQMQ